MNPIVINIKENAGITRNKEPVCIGIPIPENTLTTTQRLGLRREEDRKRLPSQFKALAHWPNGSIRWLLATFQVDVDAHQTQKIQLYPADQKPSPRQAGISGIKAVSNDLSLTVDTGQQRFVIDANDLCWRTHETSPNTNSTHIQLVDQDGNPCDASLEDGWQIIEQGAVCLTVGTHGKWQQKNKKLFAHFNCTLRFFHNSATVAIELRLHNPNRSKHQGGFWDLGDPGSIYFKSLTVEVSTAHSGQTQLETNHYASLITTENGAPIRIHQESSGGDAWSSNNHINGEGNITTAFRGYRIYSGDNIIDNGNRAQPIIHHHADAHSVQACLKDFWQNFPGALSIENGKLQISLFPGDCLFAHELQAGEQKTRTCYIDYSNDRQALQWTRAPLTPTIASHCYESAHAFPWFAADKDKGPLDVLISTGLEGPHNFFAKREIIDEYGWRNFGDIFADHETLYQKAGEPPYISHYNNQYDAIYGFARQFSLSGDPRWFELMNDLAKHVTDIDIYHTDCDRSEYNHGLFWHTDHYLDAGTATHRTYSQSNPTSSIPGQTGGGPAAEHCYTTGLLYHYFMTGNEASRQSVLDLANWMVASHEGSGGLLEQILAIKKKELPKIKALLRGEHLHQHSYPFTRGTGNYLNALLDAWQLSGEKIWLQRAEAVIKATIHPADTIAQRNLLNAEVAWSYLVLLLSISKYLLMKQQAGDVDSNYHYALGAFCHYAQWMAEHEQPFLSKPEQLEFPNDTWVAQDIRKAMLMFQAAHFDPDRSASYLAKAEEWLTYVTNTLSKSREAHYSRILIILMQNYGPHQTAAQPPIKRSVAAENHIATRAPQLTWQILTARILTRLLRGITGFRPIKEYHWLKTRLGR